jgi:hypothetical protein
MYEQQDVHAFMETCRTELCKHSACDVLIQVRRIAAHTLETLPPIIIRETKGKRPYGYVVIELEGESGNVAIYFQDAVLEFRK